MIADKAKKDRYPGIKAFERNQQSLFKGRSNETLQLFNLVLAENLVVLFSKSGVGKSSLLNAGLSHLLEARGFLPLNVRVQPTEGEQNQSPLSIVKLNLHNYAGKVKVESAPDTPLDELPLWEYIKSCSFPLGFNLVLILDQFEEFFSNQIDHQSEFLHEIKEVLHNDPPRRILDWYKKVPMKSRTQNQALWCSQPHIKVVIGIREDRFGELNSLGKVLPDIMRNRFKLDPLSLESAREAIELPASLAGSGFGTSVFSYDSEALKTLLNQLSKGKNYIETSQLQIVCNQIENKVKEMQRATNVTGAIVVTNDFFEGRMGIENIIETFYKTQFKEMENEVMRENARDLIELKMVHGGKRILLSEDQVKSFLVKNINKGVLVNSEFSDINADERSNRISSYAERIVSTLLERRLIRGDYREDQRLYEISHDTLLTPINHAIEAREKKKFVAEHMRLIQENKEKELLLEEEKKKAREERKQKDEALALKIKAELAEKKTKELLVMVEKERDRANLQTEEANKLKIKAYRLSLWLFGILIGATILFFVLYMNKPNFDNIDY